MKKLLIFLLLLGTLAGVAQVTPSKVLRVANSSTAFGENLPRGTFITDATTGKTYVAFLGLSSSKTIATCIINTDIVELTNSCSVDNSTNTSYYPLLATATGDNYITKAASSKLTFNPYTGILVSTNFQNSDIRLKRDIKAIGQSDIDLYGKFEFHKFIFKSDPDNKIHVGVIAQEVEKIMPELVNTDEKGLKSVNYIELLTAIVVSQKAAIEKLEKRLSELEQKNHEIEIKKINCNLFHTK